VAAIAVIATFACGREAPLDVDDGLQSFPAERTAADFPGVSYPMAEGFSRSGSDLEGPLWIIGIDGATWNIIQPMAERGELPNLSALTAEGAHGVLLAEEPTISPALWATIATGVPRFEHGVVNFLVKLPGRAEAVTTGPPDRHAPALWELVGAAGGEAAVVSWFGSFPAEEIRGYYVSKGFDPENLRPGQVHPPEFADSLRDQAAVRMRRGDFDGIARSELLQDTLLDDARTLAALRVIASEGRPDLVLAHFAGIDVAQHVTWRHMDPETPSFPDDGPVDPSLAGVIPAYYRYIDHTLGEIREMMPKDGTLLVLSDHGGGPMGLQEAFRLRLEVLLETVGLLDEDRGQVLAIDEFFRHDKRIWLNLEGIERAGVVPVAAAGATAAEVASRLGRLETDDGRDVFESIVDHTVEPDWRPGDPALTVRFSPAVLLTDTIADGSTSHDFSSIRLRRSDVSGTHRPEGILILHGPRSRPGPLAGPANHYQIAPLALYLLGLPQDGRMLEVAPVDGGVYRAALDPKLLELRPIEAIPEYPNTDRGALLRVARPLVDPMADPSHQESLEKLRSLGYVN
jgi:predicted AlkP superfamily phosphohydrolase/phosphomutase